MPLLLRGAPKYSIDRPYCVGVNTPKRYRQLRAKELPEVPTRRLEQNSNLRPFKRKAPNLPKSHQPTTPHALFDLALWNPLFYEPEQRHYANDLSYKFTSVNLQSYMWVLYISVYCIRALTSPLNTPSCLSSTGLI